MSYGSPNLTAGSRVTHPELGTGVFIGAEPGGYARVFFQKHGETAGIGVKSCVHLDVG